jgi:protein dithiol:quinone oxidoreductase
MALMNNTDSLLACSLFVMVLVCALTLLGLYALAWWQVLYPCPLCLLQQGTLWLLFIINTMAYLCTEKKKVLSHLLTVNILLTLFGLLLALRQVWLQHLPPEHVPPCAPGLHYLLQHLPLTESLKTVFWEASSCARVEYTIFSFSLAECSALLFMVLLAFCLRMRYIAAQ